MADADTSTGSPDTQALRARLSRVAALRADLEAEVEAIRESTESVPDDEHDPEGSTVGYERARVTALLASTRQEIENLTAGLERAAAHTYGRCEECGQDIGAERLSALPGATRCVSCAAQTPSQRPTGASPNR
ncbi:MAG TPA: TraR/DksA C4-type zinc finger protein [Acidimicrobiales bacterium]|nr:TraR/DksA C4-type zinc finger protein [Acidimicrobiales bacterium]